MPLFLVTDEIESSFKPNLPLVVEASSWEELIKKTVEWGAIQCDFNLSLLVPKKLFEDCGLVNDIFIPYSPTNNNLLRCQFGPIELLAFQNDLTDKEGLILKIRQVEAIKIS